MFNTKKYNKRKERADLNTEFFNSISFEENPFEDESPDEVLVYNIDGSDCNNEK